MRPVRVKSVEQQALQGLHRIRSLWMGTRTSRINALRGFLREFGIAVPVGARTGLEAISRVLADPASAVPELIRGSARLLVEEIRLPEARTALVAATSGDVTHFKNARHFASWFGLTPREYSSGSSRCLGKISKRSDRYPRMLLTHGARSVLCAAKVARGKGSEVSGVRKWAPQVQGRRNHNQAACALANKLARICYATLREKAPYGEPTDLRHKIDRESFVMHA
jgi:transposase